MKQATGILLAGGASSRFGTNKALVLWEGKTLIENTVARLGELFFSILVVTKNPSEYYFFEGERVAVVKDQLKDAHPLNGFYTGLLQSKTQVNFFMACDMPFPNVELIYSLWEASGGFEAAVCRWGGKVQPFFGFYSRRCLGAMERGLSEGASIEEVLFRLNTRFLSEEEVYRIDPQGFSFFDLDTQQDYIKARGLLRN